jgi:hypothetical protein
MGGVVKADGGGYVDYHHAVLWEMVWKAVGLLGYVFCLSYYNCADDSVRKVSEGWWIDQGFLWACIGVDEITMKCRFYYVPATNILIQQVLPSSMYTSNQCCQSSRRRTELVPLHLFQYQLCLSPSSF